MFAGRFGRERAARMAIRSEYRVAGEACALEPLLCRRTGNGAPRSPGSGGSPNNSAGAYPSTGQTSQCCSERVPLGRHEDAPAGHQAGSRVEGSDKAAYRSGATGTFSPTGLNKHKSCPKGGIGVDPVAWTPHRCSRRSSRWQTRRSGIRRFRKPPSTPRSARALIRVIASTRLRLASSVSRPCRYWGCLGPRRTASGRLAP